MILKWLDSNGEWHLKDGVRDLHFRGRYTLSYANEVVKKLDGDHGYLAYLAPLPIQEDKNYLFGSAIFHGEHAHFVMDNENGLYVLSDDGKTVDRF